MKREDIKPGAKFRDLRLETKPEEYRLFLVKSEPFESAGRQRFEATHIASGSTRTFDTTAEALEGLEVVRSVFLLTADLDSLVGERVRIDLIEGSSLRGTITAIRYQKHAICGTESRTVSAIEIDHSGATSYQLRDIKKIDRL